MARQSRPQRWVRAASDAREAFDKMLEAQGELHEALATLTELKEEYQEWYDNMRCATVKYIKIDSRDGDTVGHPSYHYTDGYQLKEGGSMTHRERTAIRLAEIRGNLKGDV